MPNKNNVFKTYGKLFIISAILIASLASFVVVYRIERQEEFRGEATYNLSYRYYFKNKGPVNLTSVTLRLAMLKDWAPVQEVTSNLKSLQPNQTTTDEYENEFAWYEYTNFQINQTLDLTFNATVKINFVDYTTPTLAIEDYDEESAIYQLFTAYHPLTDASDPNILRVAESLSTSENPIERAFNFYNFTSSYIEYQLLSSSRGATYALQNGQGDCDEYTTLFIALARASGIPAIGHTAWLGDFEPGFVSTDDGSIAHAYPMFYVEGVGMLPADPTRGNKQLFDNWLKTDHKRITMTRGPDHPYRLLNYKWIPVSGLSDPIIDNNYTIAIHDVNIKYTSILRAVVIYGLPSSAGLFIVASIIRGLRLRKENKEKLEKLLNPRYFSDIDSEF